MSGRPTAAKRQKERQRQDKQREKQEKRRQRRVDKNRNDRPTSSEDLDIAGIVPGPQPVQE